MDNKINPDIKPNDSDPDIPSYALFELMGHSRIIGSVVFCVTVLDYKGKPWYTRALSPSAIFSMTWLTESDAIELAKKEEYRPDHPVDLQVSAEIIRAKLRKEIDQDSREFIQRYSQDDDESDDPDGAHGVIAMIRLMMTKYKSPYRPQRQ